MAGICPKCGSPADGLHFCDHSSSDMGAKVNITKLIQGLIEGWERRKAEIKAEKAAEKDAE